MRPSARWFAVGFGIVASVFVAACGSAVQTGEGTGGTVAASAPTSAETSQQYDIYLNWDNPNGGTLADSFATAQRDTSFSVLVPQGLGDPASIYVNTPNPGTDLVTAVYDSPIYGRVIVEQETSHVTSDQWSADVNQVISQNGTTDHHGTASWVDVGGGVTAFATTTEDGTQSTLAWLRDNGSVELDILGPSLSADQAKAIAAGLGTTTAGVTTSN